MRSFVAKNGLGKRKIRRFTPLTIFLLIFLILFSATIIYALYWVIITSFKLDDAWIDGNAMKPTLDFFGSFPSYQRMRDAWASQTTGAARRYVDYFDVAKNDCPFLPLYTYKHTLTNFTYSVFDKYSQTEITRNIWDMFLYSFLYAGGSALVGTLIPCIVAYLCARFDYKFSKIIYVIVIATMIIPIVGSLPSEIEVSQKLGLFNTFWGLWVMKANFLGVYFLVFYEQFRSMPKAYTEAAKIDGASNLRIMFQIILPLVKNLILTVFIIKFVEFWNDYQTPLIFQNKYPTISMGLINAMKMQPIEEGILYQPQSLPAIMADVVIAILPVVAIFVIFQKRMLGNLTEGGIKE